MDLEEIDDRITSSNIKERINFKADVHGIINANEFIFEVK